ncbi:MAG: HDIG domain-containing protein [Bacillota bacterium]|nr:hypothetical protein [Bacillota bacterium]
MPRSGRSDARAVLRAWNASTVVRIGLLLALWGLLFTLALPHARPTAYELKVGEPSPVTLVAPYTVEDPEETQRARQRAEAGVEPVFRRDDRITANQIEVLERVFAEAKALASSNLPASGRIERLKAAVPYELADEVYTAMARLSPQTVEVARAITVNTVEQILLEGVTDQATGVKAAREKVDEQLVRSDLGRSVRTVVRALVLASVVPNVFYDEAETEKRRALARSLVKPVTIEQGTVLVEKGALVTPEGYRKAKLLGLVETTPSPWPMLGLAGLAAMLVAILWATLASTGKPSRRDNRTLLMLVLIAAVQMIALKAVALWGLRTYPYHGFVAPAALGASLIAALVGKRVALAGAMLFATLAALLYNESFELPLDFRYALVALAGSVAGVYSIGRITQRHHFLLTGFTVSGVASAAAAVVVLLTARHGAAFPWPELLMAMGFAFAGGWLSTVLTVGLLPFFENAFGVLSSVRLVMLSNPNHPLLRKLLIETPGTYHHSMVVANLAEAAAEAIGANGLLARVGAYYHDIGKTKRPQYFIENQYGAENPHDRLSPYLSKRIILAHPYDGAAMLKAHKIPKPIRDIAEQHHGTTLLKYFYHKAKQQHPDSEVREEDFRYPGPKAQTKEAAIVGICDCVEAAVRSMKRPTPSQLDHLVRRIVKERLDDGQFHECDLTLRELEVISRTIVEALIGMFHSRIEYPADVRRDESSAAAR